jgi:MFS family permease
VAWHSEITWHQWRVLAAALLGWMLDAMDVMLYAFALTAIRDEFGMTSAGAGALVSVTLIASAIGGIGFGMLADRIGRARALVYSILTYSIFTAFTATAGSVAELALWRTLVGFGLGGEWSAGSVLVAETWPARHRGKAIGVMQSGWAIGYILAALLAAAIVPRWGWRMLFVAGVAPALLALWIRRAVPEPEIWRRKRERRAPLSRLWRADIRRNGMIATAMATTVLFAYWGLFTWIPAYLASPVENGGAGMTLVRSAAWIVLMQTGAFLGYLLFGFLADRFGRRPVFLFFVLAAAAVVPAFGLYGRHGVALLILGPLVGFFGHGYFSVFGAMLAELFPSAIRATAQGLCYNAGRAASALAPVLIGTLADGIGVGAALAFTSLFFVASAGFILLLPETRGEALA